MKRDDGGCKVPSLVAKFLSFDCKVSELGLKVSELGLKVSELGCKDGDYERSDPGGAGGELVGSVSELGVFCALVGRVGVRSGGHGAAFRASRHHVVRILCAVVCPRTVRGLI